MKKAGVILLVVVGIGLIIAVINSVSTRSFIAKAERVRVGDAKTAVERLLGRPVAVFTPSQAARTNWLAALFEVSTETWAYGRNLQFSHAFSSEFPYFCPLRLRLFRPDSDDVVIEFDSSGKVSEISIPSH